MPAPPLFLTQIKNASGVFPFCQFYSSSVKRRTRARGRFLTVANVFAGAQAPTRKAGLPLVLGVVVAPFLFAWLLLRPGHSEFSRTAGFGWLAVYAMIAFGLQGHAPQLMDNPYLSHHTTIVAQR
jgi:hypothetical protein